MKRRLLVLITIFIGTISYSQVTQEWVALYNGGGIPFQESDHLIATDGSGNVYVVANTGSEADSNYATIKYDSLGVEQWVRTYGGPGDGEDVAKAIATDAGGNVYVTGGSEGSGTGRDYATIKYNTLGVEQWVQRYNGPANTHDRAFSIAVDTSGNVYVTGESDGSGTGTDFATVKYSSGGVEQWVRRYNGTGNSNDFGQRVRTDASGNAYVTGAATGAGTETDFATIKYSTLGFEEWVRVYNGPGNLFDWPFSIAADEFGNVYVTGQSWGIGTFDDYATIKYNSNGDQQWVQRYDGEGQSDIARGIGTDNSGNVYVTGGSYRNGTDWDFATIKYDTDGGQQWVQTYNGPANSTDAAYAIAVDGIGNAYVTGLSLGASYDFATMKYDPNGVRQWVQGYDRSGGASDEIAYSIVVDGSGNVYVAGGSQVTLDSYDYTAIRYSQTTTTSQGWVSQTSGTQDNLYGVHFTDTENGVVVGASGTILRTTDGGASWVDLSIARPDTFFSVHFSDENNGIIVGGIPAGGGSVILRTIDGGLNWNEQVPGTSNVLRSVFCIDNDRAVAVGESGTILRTTDAGMTWSPQGSCYGYVLFAVTFIDNNIGIKVTGWPAMGFGGPIGLTSDGGVSWTCSLPPGPILTSVSFW